MPSQGPGFDTMLMGVPGGAAPTTTTAYQQTPAGPPTLTGPYGTGDGPHDDGPRRRSAWTIPLVILIVILAVLLVVFLVNQIGHSSSTKSTPPAGASGGTSSSASSTPASASASAIVLDPSDYVGEQYSKVKAQLAAMNLTVVGDPLAATSSDVAGKVTKIDPTNTTTGGTVTVTYYGAATTPSAPTTAPTTASKTVTTGQAFTVSWPTYKCASGTGGALSGYTVRVAGAAANAGDIPLDAVQSTSVTAGSSAGTITISYSANCGPAETDGYSPTLKVTVKAPTAPTTTAPTTPTPATTETTATQ
jgi:serine/threonine-protein kinase